MIVYVLPEFVDLPVGVTELFVPTPQPLSASNTPLSALLTFGTPATGRRRWSCSPRSSKVYELFAVLVHQGDTAEAGHYYALIRDEQGVWRTFDDENVVLMEASELQAAMGGGAEGDGPSCSPRSSAGQIQHFWHQLPWREAEPQGRAVRMEARGQGHGKHYRILEHTTGYFYQEGFLPSDTAMRRSRAKKMSKKTRFKKPSSPQSRSRREARELLRLLWLLWHLPRHLRHVAHPRRPSAPPPAAVRQRAHRPPRHAARMRARPSSG
jgi:hypothetical protein